MNQVNDVETTSKVHVLPFLFVAILWGFTDVLIARASKQSKEEFRPGDFSPFKLIKLIWKKKIWVWMGINQVGSVLYAYLLGIYPQQYSLIWANSLTVTVAFIFQKVLNYASYKKSKNLKITDSSQMLWFEQKKRRIRKQAENILGIGLILMGIYLMMI